jgi:hypothetical protein
VGNFSGGSAYGMASQICEGYIVVNPLNLKRMSRVELGQLQFELKKLTTELRGEQPIHNDTQALQGRNRKLSRLRQAQQVVEHRMRGR